MLTEQEIPIEIDQELIVRNLLPVKPIPKCSVAEYISGKMQEWSQNSLIGLENSDTGEQMTYSEWYEKSKYFASSLIDFGLNKDDLVLLFGTNTIEHAIALIGTIYTGMVFSMVTPANGQYELTKQIEDSQGSVLIIEGQKLRILRSALDNDKYRPIILAHLELVIVFNCADDDEQFVQVKERAKIGKSISFFTLKQMLKKGSKKIGTNFRIPYFSVKPDDYFMIVYTSGTTGLPKGAIHSNYSALASLVNCHDKDLKGMRCVLWFPLGHVSGTYFLLCSLQSGFHIVLFAEINLDKMLEYVAKHKLTQLAIAPDQVSKLVNYDYHLKYDLNSLKIMWGGGSKVSPDHIRMIEDKYNVIFLELYGATELLSPTRNDLYHNVAPRAKHGSVGKLEPGMEMKIVDLETGKNLPANQHGEVCMRGSRQFVGYLRNEKATKAATDQDGFYHFGDVGYYDQDGWLFIADRIKELIKFRQWSIFPSEIEDFLLKHDAIQYACVVGVKHTQDVSLVRAYVQLKDGCRVTEDEIVKYVQDNMGFQKRLRGGVRFVENMPKTSIGKIDRKYFHNLVKDEILTQPVD